jgi:hypothetical protein
MNYDNNGNINRNSDFEILLLQNISNTVRNALNNLSNEIKNNLFKEEYNKYFIIEYKNLLNKENKNCPICFDDYIDTSLIIKTECLHCFHEECLKKWINKNNTCPICRSTI